MSTQTAIHTPDVPLCRMRFPIVGIGASSGGLEALQAFLAQVPAISHMAYIIIQHLEPLRPSLLQELLQSGCPLPVIEILDGQVVEADHVYVIPPDHELSLKQGVLHLQPPSPHQGKRHTIDHFLQSLAEDCQELAIGVLLSGTGSDGTLGLQAIKSQAGLTAVQSPQSAREAEMPRCAIQAGLADIIALAEELPAELLNRRARHPAFCHDKGFSPHQDGRLTQIIALLHSHTGQDFSCYKQNTLCRRIERRMGLCRLSHLDDYIRLLQQTPAELDILLQELLINVTRFFRDPEVWNCLREELIPQLLRQHPEGGRLRAWCAGCASGEEAYSLAMTFCEALDQTDTGTRFSLQIFATDLDQQAIAQARRGLYAGSIAQDVSGQRLERFFTPDDKGYRVSKGIRDMVVFAPHNLLTDPSFGKLDLLICRNLLIYLAPNVHETLLSRFHYSMNPDAILLLGSSESIGSATHLFAPLPGQMQLYQRLNTPLQEKRLDFLARSVPLQSSTALTPMAPTMKTGTITDLQTLSDQILMRHYAPTAVLVNDLGDILHINGKTAPYLDLVEGKANLNILCLVRAELKSTLDEAFHEALRLQEPVSLTCAYTDPLGQPKSTRLCVHPLRDQTSRPEILVIFIDAGVPAESMTPDTEALTARQGSRLRSLEQTLQHTRDALQLTREEMQTSREELTSTNEELQSTNEELTTSAEELRTMNEELVRARAEAEQTLARYTDLFDSAPVGYFTLDKSGAIVQANLAGALLLGMERERVAGSRLVMFVTEADRLTFIDCLRQAFEQPEAQLCEVSLWQESQAPRQISISALAEHDSLTCRVVVADITERKNAEEKAERERDFITSSMNSLPGIVYLFDHNGRFLRWNQNFEQVSGYSRAEIMQMRPQDFFRSDDTEKLAKRIGETFSSGQSEAEGFFVTKDGKRIPYHFTGKLIQLEGESCLIGMGLDISQRQQAEDARKKEALRFRTMFERAPLGIALIDGVSGDFLDVNPRFAEITRRASDDLKQLNWMAITQAEDIKNTLEQMSLLNAQLISDFKLAQRLIRPDHSLSWIDLSVAPLAHDETESPCYLCMIEDITDKRETESLIWQQANFDALTQLPNRRMFRDRLEHDLIKSHREGLALALLFIDLDRFKEVNDTLGHSMGDLLLVEAASRIQHQVRESDTVARLGGDEFTVTLAELDDMCRVEVIVQNILRSLSEPFTLGSEQAFVSASIGITLYPNDATSIDDLLKHADQALYVAKDSGRNRFSYFTPELQVAALARMRMTNDLRGALEKGEFRVYYQPVVDMISGRIHKAEALIRWQHADRGLVSPAEFIPLAEASGLIIDIGEWVFQESARWLQRWRQQGHQDLQISVNQSPLEFQRDSQQHHQWQASLRQQGLSGRSLVIEITEGLLLDVSDKVISKLIQLRDMGIQIALDDFGTGYSSLSYLNKLDIDYLKIDQSFTRNLAPGSSDMALSEAIIVMAHKLGLKVIAEGVETAEQRDLLIGAGCDYGQGYLFARPMPPEQLEALLQTQNQASPARQPKPC